MRYESIPRKIINSTKSTFNFMKEEFGNLTYLILVFLGFLLYKPIKMLFDLTTSFILYGFIGLVVVFLGYRLFKKYV